MQFNFSIASVYNEEAQRFLVSSLGQKLLSYNLPKVNNELVFYLPVAQLFTISIHSWTQGEHYTSLYVLLNNILVITLEDGFWVDIYK